MIVFINDPYEQADAWILLINFHLCTLSYRITVFGQQTSIPFISPGINIRYNVLACLKNKVVLTELYLLEATISVLECNLK